MLIAAIFGLLRLLKVSGGRRRQCCSALILELGSNRLQTRVQVHQQEKHRFLLFMKNRVLSYQQQVLSGDPDSVGERVIVLILHKLVRVG